MSPVCCIRIVARQYKAAGSAGRGAGCYIAAVNHYDVIILGGGAAGLMCAITAGRRGRRVIVLEGSNRIGKKILMSGGGRCNFTNLHCEPDNFLSANPAFCISALSRYTQWDFIALVEKHGIPYHEKTAGQLFCDRSSKDIVSMLALECRSAGVRIETHCGISSVRHDRQYAVSVNGTEFTAGSLVIATGGLSIPRMGASDFGYRLAIWLNRTGHACGPGAIHALRTHAGDVGAAIRRQSAGNTVMRQCCILRRHPVHAPGTERAGGITVIELLDARHGYSCRLAARR